MNFVAHRRSGVGIRTRIGRPPTGERKLVDAHAEPDFTLHPGGLSKEIKFGKVGVLTNLAQKPVYCTAGAAGSHGVPPTEKKTNR